MTPFVPDVNNWDEIGQSDATFIGQATHADGNFGLCENYRI